MNTETKEGAIVVPEQSYSRRELATQPQATNLVQALAAAASDPRTDMDKMERLFAMHQKMVAQQAEAQFNDALARAQANVQPIANNAENDHTRSRYAKLAQINKDIMPIYTAEGLSVSFDTYSPQFDKDGKEINPPAQGMVRVIAILSHSGGHSRRYHLDGELDAAGTQGTRNKTGIQAMGSTVSYLRRYLVCMIFNIATFDDNDGNKTGGQGGEQMDEGALADWIAAIDGSGSIEELQENFSKAYSAARKLKDNHAMKLLTQHKDTRKKTLGGKK